MKNVLFISLLISIAITQQRSSYSWEDGTGTILGSYGNLANPANVGTTSGVSPYDGSRMLTVSESPLDGTPQAFIAWVTDLSAGQSIEACFYGYDNTPSSAPSLRIWGSWSTNDDITSYQGSADGNTDYTAGSGWGQVCHTFSTNQENWDSGEALVIQARLYSSASGPDPTVYFIDLVEVTAPGGATVTYPDVGAEGCTDPDAANYNPNAADPCNGNNSCCEYSVGDVSIYNIQYTTDVGDGSWDCYPSPYGIFGNEQYVTTSGVITGIKPESNSFFIQDFNSTTYSGIYVFDSFQNPVLGNKVDFTAQVEEYYGFTELTDVSSLSVISSGNSLTIKDIATGDLANGCTATGESLEGMLVRISDVFVTQTIDDEYGEFTVDDGSGECQIDNWMFDGEEWIDPSLGQEFASITGVVGYGYPGVFEILPRTMSDIILCGTCPVCDAGDNQSVAPNSTVTLDGSGSYDPDGSIVLYEWTQTGGIAVNLFNEEAESTTFDAPNSISELVFKLTIFDNDFNEASDEVTISVGYGTSIYDIQCPDDLEQGTYCYETSLAGDEVSTSGIVTHVLPPGHSSEGNFFLQQPGMFGCAGIFIRDFDIIPNVGDLLTLTGTVNEYYSFTQIIDVTSSSVGSSGNSTTPLTITTGDLGIVCTMDGEELEGMLVQVLNVTVEDIDEFGNVQINDGSGSTLMDDYYFDGDWPSISVGETISSIVGNVGYSYSEFKIYPRNEEDFSGCCEPGDLNCDETYNVLDIVNLANCILAQNCDVIEGGCAGDLNGDGIYNVLDIVTLANCILAQNCGGRVDDATESSLIMKDNMVSIEADGFIGGVQMTLTHGDDFSIKMTDRALLAEYITTGNETRLLVITPETDELFSFSGEFEITEIMVANSQYEISVDLPLAVSFSLSGAYPNPFNPVTTMDFMLSNAGNVNVQVYNLQGQIVSTLLSGYQTADTYTLIWEAYQVPSGMYFVKAEADGFTETQKLMLIK